MSGANKAVVRRFVEETFIQHDSSNIEELVSNESLKQMAPATVAAFPDMEMTIEHLIGEDDIVAVRISANATHLGDFQGIPPTALGSNCERVVRGLGRKDRRLLGELGLARDHGGDRRRPACRQRVACVQPAQGDGKASPRHEKGLDRDQETSVPPPRAGLLGG